MKNIYIILALTILMGCSPKSDYEVCIEKMGSHITDVEEVSKSVAEGVAAKQCADLMNIGD